MDIKTWLKEFKSVFGGDPFCTKHTGKMIGMISLSTSVLLNAFCKKRSQNKKSICSKCYSGRMTRRYKTLEKKLARNTDVLTKIIIPVWPVLNCQKFRFESFGDLNNVTQVINYFNLCNTKGNEDVHFALWTKNPWFIAQAIKSGYEKPKNLSIIYSSPCLNIIAEKVFDIFPFIDKVFTVFDNEDTVPINCGARCCVTCGKCYDPNNGIKFINEKVK